MPIGNYLARFAGRHPAPETIGSPPRSGNTITPSTAPSTFDIEQTATLRRVIGRLSRRLRPTAAGAEAGLTPTRVSVLLHAVRSGPIRLSDIGAAEGINPTMLSRVVSELADAGLLERLSDAGDRRAVWVKASAAGRRLAERIRRQRTEALNVALAQLSDEHRRQIEHALPALDALAEALKDRA